VPRARGGGPQVTREYYFNDFGAQVRNLGASVVAIRRGEPLPEEAYRGAYVGDLAAEIPDDVWSAAQAPDADPVAIVGQWASERVRAGIEESLAHLGVRFDVWKSEGSLYRDGWVARAVERLEAAGALYEDAGALWFRSTSFGDDKDRVVRKSNGDWTYFGSDVGYVVEKFSRGFDRLVYIWGADHHGTVARLRNAAAAMGYDREAVQMILMAWVRFVRDGVEVSMSKRSGEFITLDELLSEIGVDAARWFFAARGHTSGIDFDIELAKKQSAENPVYYVQYAHARIASILRKAAEAGLAPGVAGGAAGPQTRLAERPRGAPERGWGARAALGRPAGQSMPRHSPARRRLRWSASSPASRRSCRTRPSPRRPTGSPPTPPTSRRSSTPSTATRGSSILPSRNAPRPVSHWCVRRS
jgi:arginyl-tRNA synthetase